MRVKEAKDFLVRETAEQAELEGVPLSELEKRMMYFTEGPSAPEDPSQLNEKFEAEYATEQFEAKVTGFMRHARQRLEKEEAGKAAHWDRAIRCLEKGDHYILVLCGSAGKSSSSPVSLRLISWLVLAAVPLGMVIAAVYFITRHFAPPHGPAMRILQVLFLALLIATIFFPKALAPVGNVVGRYLDLVEGWLGTEEGKHKNAD